MHAITAPVIIVRVLYWFSFVKILAWMSIFCLLLNSSQAKLLFLCRMFLSFFFYGLRFWVPSWNFCNLTDYLASYRWMHNLLWDSIKYFSLFMPLMLLLAVDIYSSLRECIWILKCMFWISINFEELAFVDYIWNDQVSFTAIYLNLIN